MKLIGDEHVSPKIITEIREKCLPSRAGWTIESVVGSKYAGREDEDWVSAFASDGGNVLISADRDMLQRHTMIVQIALTGLVGIYVRGGYANSTRLEQLAHIFAWWPKIEEKIIDAAPGSVWIIPNGRNTQRPLRECKPFGKPMATFLTSIR